MTYFQYVGFVVIKWVDRGGGGGGELRWSGVGTYIGKVICCSFRRDGIGAHVHIRCYFHMSLIQSSIGVIIPISSFICYSNRSQFLLEIYYIHFRCFEVCESFWM